MASTTPDTAPAKAASPELINRSCRTPVMLLLGGAVAWSLIGLLLGLVSSVKMHAPGMWDNCPWMSYGRLRPAFFTAILHGFASQGLIGVALWMIARLGRTPLAQPGVAAAGALLWNVAVGIGVLQIMGGASTGLPWMEMPRQSASFLAAGYFLLAISAFYTLRIRREKSLYITHWFVVSALLAFPWLLSIAYLLGVVNPLRGVMQAVVGAYYSNGLFQLWLTPMTLGVAYYLIPKCTGKPIFSRQTAMFGFWALIILANWSGTSQLIGGPLPRWIIGVGVSAKWMLLLAVAAYGINYYITVHTGKGPGNSETGGAFVVMGSVMYGVWALLDVMATVPSVATRVAFTLFGQGLSHLALFGFVGLILHGAMYYVTARLMEPGFKRRGLVQVHFLCAVLGVFLLGAAYLIGGYVQGGNLSNLDVPMNAAIKGMVPFIGIASLGYVVLLAGQAAFAWALLRIVVEATAEERSSLCRWCCDEIGSDRKAKVRA